MNSNRKYVFKGKNGNERKTEKEKIRTNQTGEDGETGMEKDTERRKE